MASAAAKRCKDGPMPHPSVAFRLKCEREIDKLNDRLRKHLQNDMLNLFQEKPFADVSFITEDHSEISAHLSLLKVRVPTFYNRYVKDQLNCRIPIGIELSRLNKIQLQSFLRSVYCGEDIEGEELSILEALNSVQLADYNQATLSKRIGISMEVEPEKFDPLENNGETSSSYDRSEQQLCSNLDNEGNELDDYSSVSEVFHCNGTLTDLTDPFSISTSDMINVSTLNANDDIVDATSLISVEELNGSEASDGVEINNDQNAAPAQEIFAPDVKSGIPMFEDETVLVDEICNEADDDVIFKFCPSSVDSKSAELQESMTDVFQYDVAILESETAQSAPESRLTIRRGTFELELAESSDASHMPKVITENGSGQGKMPVGEECFANEVQSAADVCLMVCSHESKDGDSGVCSMVRKLSTSSSFGHRSNCSEHVPDSPPESLPKDDSLEFCADFLGGEDAHLGICPSGPSDSGFGVADAAQLNLSKGSVRKSLPLALDKPTTSEPLWTCLPFRKEAWADETRELQVGSEVEPRCWSVCGDVQLKGILKPSAIVQPYVHEDVKSPPKTILLPCLPKQVEDGLLSHSAPPLTSSLRHKIDSQSVISARCSIQLDFVPFLKEERITGRNTSIGSDVKSELQCTMLTSTPLHDLSVTSGFGIEPVVVSSADEVSVPVESDVKLSLELDTGAAPVEDGEAAGPHSPTQLEENTNVENDYKGGESEICKPEGSFMFIDVSSTKPESCAPPDVEMPAERAAESLEKSVESPKKKAEGFYFIPADVELDSSSENKQSSLDDEPVAKVNAPQAVYMYIEATGSNPVTCSSPSALKHSKLGERKVPVLRRRTHAGVSASPNRRPKSESAATLLADADATDSGRQDKCVKRISLAFGEENDAVTYSIGSSENGDARDDAAPAGRKSCSRLGEDLLRMFLDEINPDVTVRVDGKDIKAHKSILTSRCVYFAAMLSGGWVESAGNVIKLQGFSYDAVHFAICHIYSGSSSVPDSIDISELASLADMLGLEGLKEVVTLTLKMKMCHFFHKPCATCITSVSECLLIALSFGLDELQEKCLKWVTRHMLKTWPTKAFAALPDEILQKCLLNAKMEIMPDTVLDTLLRCDKLMATLPHIKWTEPVFKLTTQLADTASSYLSANFADVLTSNSFLALRSGQSWSIHALEATFLLAVERLPLDSACQAYVRLNALLNIASTNDDLENSDINENFDALLTKIHRQVEHFLIHNANRVVRCNSWAQLSPDLQKRIKDAAVIVFEFGKPTAAPPRLSSLNRKFTRARASNSTSSASPTIERARVSSNSSSATRVPQKSVVVPKKTEEKVSKHNVKAATLPRIACRSLSETKAHDDSRHGGLGSVRGPGRGHVNSRTLPMTKTTKLKKMDLSANRPSRAGNQHGVAAKSGPPQKNVSAGVCDANTPYAMGSSIPKSLPVKERNPPAATVRIAKDKTPVRELPKDTRLLPANSSSVALRLTARLSNGSAKAMSPAPRPKSVPCNGSYNSGKMAKQSIGSPTANVRDSKASSLRKAASSDFQGKINKDELKPRSATRPKSDDVSSSGSRKSGPRVPLNKSTSHKQ